MADVSRAERRPKPFWLRPKWLVGHLLVVALVATFVSLGFWQLDRLDVRKQRNADITARAQLPAAPVAEVIPTGATLDGVDGLQYRRVTATGRYDADAGLLVRPRSLDGVSGWHVVTPLVLGDGRAVLVTRGFAPFASDLDVVRDAVVAPAGEVTVTGLAFPTQEREGIGPTDPQDGVLEELARVDIGRVQQQYERDLLPVYVQLETQQPPQDAELPRVLPAPVTDEGPHLSYAVQWFLFAGVGLVGWPVLLRRTSRDEHRADGRPPLPGPGSDPGDGDDAGGGDGGGGGSRGPTPDAPRPPVTAGVG